MDNIVIRKATKDDFNYILNLSNQLWKAEQPFDSNLKDNYYHSDSGKDTLLRDIKSRKRIFLVAVYKKCIIGYADGYIKDRKDAYVENVSYLDRISVDSEYKQLGVGTKLIDAFITKSKEKNCKFIKLNAFEQNMPAVNLYKKLGFSPYSVFYMKRI